MSRLLTTVGRRFATTASVAPRISESGAKILAEEAAIEKTAAENAETWRKISLFVALPLTGLIALYAFKLHHDEEHHLEEHPPTYTAYPYLRIRNKQYFFGDRDHTAFFNPKYNLEPAAEGDE
ncbi:Cytochrome c oxidase subunit 6A1, mitochondrial [Sorochytrium milnesiophthora]